MELPSNLLPDEASPEWMNKGDNAWQLTANTVVGLQSIPGLVILYGSLVKKTWAVNSAFMAFYAFAAVLLCWVSWAFRMSFGDKLVFFLGRVVLDDKLLLGNALLGLFPTATVVFFQGMFAGITFILIAGALLGRMNFRAWMLFVPLWLTFSYTVTAFSIWSPNGWLAKQGVIDFSGGYFIHLSAGVAGFTAAYWVCIHPTNFFLFKFLNRQKQYYAYANRTRGGEDGKIYLVLGFEQLGPRSYEDREESPQTPNNMIMVLAGAGLLWMG